MNIYPLGNNLTVKWSLLYSDGSTFPIGNYDFELSYRNSRGTKVVTDSSVISTEENVVIWHYNADSQVSGGMHTLILKINYSGSRVIELTYDNAFILSSMKGVTTLGAEVILESYCDVIDLKEALRQASDARDRSVNAETKSTTALSNSETAKTNAAAAVTTANEAKTMATQASADAEDAKDAAEAAEAAEERIEDALDQLSEDQSGALALATTVNGHTTKLTTLESEVSEIAGAFVDVSTLTEYKYAILDTLKWGSNNLAKHIYIPISAGQTIKIVGNATNNTYGAFLTTIAGAVSAGASIPIVSGQSRMTITANQSNSFTAPTGAVCFCLVTKSASGTNVTDVTPQSVAVILKNIASVVESIDGRITEDEEFLWLNGAMSRHGGKRVNTYVVTSSGLFTTNPQNGYSIFYRVKAGSTIHIKANASLATTYTFTTDTYVYAGRIAHFATGYTTNATISAGEEADVVVPSNAKYLLLWETTQSGSDKFPATLTASNAITDTIPSVDDVAQIREDVDTLMGGGARTDIVSLNDPIFTENMLRQISRTYYPTSANAVKPLVLLHFSDIHGYGTSQREMVRLMEFKERYDSYIDDAICTGDMIYDSYDRSNMTFWDNAGADDIMTVIGNHDATDSTQQTQPNDGTGTTSKQCYDRYVAPYVENWGVTITGEVCYYYKDYATEKIRLVVLDEYHYDTAQDSWLVATLESARTLGYHILMATHSVNGNLVNREGTFAMLEGSGDGMKTTIGSKQRVQDFMDAGGKLICWICGHGHYDNMGYSYGFENQLRIQVTCAKADAASKYDVARTANTKFEDAFNIMSIDTRFGFIRIFRIGADYDRNMRHRSTILIDYINHKIISNESVYGLDAIAKIESQIGVVNAILESI